MARRPGQKSSSSQSKQRPAFRRALTRLRKRLRELRKMHGLSYAELHERSGVNWRQIVAIEQGEPSNPTLVTLTRLAEALGVEVHELLTPAQSGVRRKITASKAAALDEPATAPDDDEAKRVDLASSRR